MSRKINAIKSYSALWIRHEEIYSTLFQQALQIIEIDDIQRNNEDAISESLNPILRKLCFKNKEREIKPPVWEAPYQPATEEDCSGGKKRKRPDFTCGCIDRSAKSPETYEIPLHVECKRLGKGLNSNYVKEGIQRFDSNEHKYGFRAPSGMMLGYMINMEQSEILQAVNHHISNGKPELNFVFSQKVVSCRQTFIRKNVKPEEFQLIHLWSDLRKN